MTFLGAFAAAFAVAAFIMLLNAWVEHSRTKSSLSVPFRWQLGQFNQPGKKYTTNQRKPVKHYRNSILILSILALAALCLLPACKTGPDGATVVDTNAVNRAAAVAKVAVRAGVAADVIANPQHRTQIKLSADSLEVAVKAGKMTGGTLASVVASLPIDRSTVRVVTGALLIYDSVAVLWWDAQSQWAVDTIALAVAEGAKEGLLMNPVVVPETQLRAARAPDVILIPVPTAANTKKL